MPYATYRFNKIIAAETIRFIVTVAIVVYKGLKLVVYRMLTLEAYYEDLLVSGSSFRYIKCARFWLRYSLKRLFRFIIPESIMIKRRRLRIERNQDTKCVYWKKS